MASSYGYIKKGAQGDTVKWIQEQLGINADGIFGSQTEKAIRDFQAKQGIKVDGIVGNETMEYLLGANKAYSAPQPAQPSINMNAGGSLGGGYSPYSQSQAVIDAANRLTQHDATRPGPYQSQYGDQIQAMLDKILNREDFKYDFNADPLYQQMSQRFQQQGQNAMMDAMGNAAMLTGGYGNSYGQMVGQQAYQQHLQTLNDTIPQLRDAAYQMYLGEGDKMRSDMQLLQGLESADYGKYRDTMGDFYNDRDYLANRYDTEYQFDLSRYNADRDYAFNQQQFAFNQQQAAQDQANWQKEYELALQKAKSSGSGSSSKKTGNSSAQEAFEAMLSGDDNSEYSLQDAFIAANKAFVSNGNNRAAAESVLNEAAKAGHISSTVKQEAMSLVDEMIRKSSGSYK